MHHSIIRLYLQADYLNGNHAFVTVLRKFTDELPAEPIGLC